VFDLEIDERDPDKLIDTIASLEPTFGGINLEDIKAPECFYIEKKLRERMKNPVFHDDQHGTAIVVGAAVLNGLHLIGKDLSKGQDRYLRRRCCGACLPRPAGHARAPPVENIWVTDIKGLVYEGRVEEMDEIKARYVKETDARTLSEAIEGADVSSGCLPAASEAGNGRQNGANPLIMALANPTPEITPELVKSVRRRRDHLYRPFGLPESGQ
jgi:malate dehydrogenase (oxaloacetate-decarboxylating)(NADP+)